MKIYSLEFHREALKEWEKLDGSVKAQFKSALIKRLANPHIPSARLSADLENCYKIKLAAVGYRLVYEVFDDRLVVMVIAVGKRDKLEAYNKASSRR